MKMFLLLSLLSVSLFAEVQFKRAPELDVSSSCGGVISSSSTNTAYSTVVLHLNKKGKRACSLTFSDENLKEGIALRLALGKEITLTSIVSIDGVNGTVRVYDLRNP